jgi:thiosulfate/3-mercaptopyruvate sulfurtransferase
MLRLAATLSFVMLLAISPGVANALDFPGALVQTDWLAANLRNRQLVVLDVRSDPQNFVGKPPPPEAKFDPKATVIGHIPGARLWDFKRVRENRIIDHSLLEKMVPAKGTFEAMMRELGLRNTHAVVVVTNASDSVTLSMGTRVYWTLKYYGHEKVALLDGGTLKWASEKRSMSYNPAPFEKSDYVARERRDLLATTEDVEAALQNDSAQLVDGRTADFYIGQSITHDVRMKGHIPGAKMLSHVELADEKAKTIKSPDALRELAKRYDIDVSQPIITYCDTGQHSSLTWFVLSELLGNPAVRLYDGSMHEWTRNYTREVSARWEMN